VKELTPALSHGFTAPAVGRSVAGAWAAQIAVFGFVAGHSCLPNMEFHLGWLLIAALPALACTEWTPHLQRWKADAGALAVISFVLWMLLRSCWQIPFMPEHALGEIVRGIAGAILLVVFCALLWLEAQSNSSLHAMGWVMGMTSALAALISIVLCYFVLPDHQAGERLMNLLVHGGLNPVCTGLIFGFAAVWLAALVENRSKPLSNRTAWAAIALLHFAAFLSGSRGAMLAMAGGNAVLLIARGWRRGRMAACVFVLAGLCYFTSAPLFTRVTQWRAQPVLPTAIPRDITHHFQKAVARGDNSRMDIYRAGWNIMDNRLMGTGQWGVSGLWQCELQSKTDISTMGHLHSAFFATLVHGGFIGLSLLLLALGCGIQRAWRLAAGGDATWLALLTFGCAGLLFDGESLASLATAPRYEGLLFWLPLTVALARGSATARRADS
jgi:O-Antigen ligase